MQDQAERIREVAGSYLSEPIGDDGAGMRWGMLREDVAYLSIAGHPPDDQIPDLKATLGELIPAIADVPDLVVDLRFDWGGFDTAGQATAGYFAAARTPAFTKAARDGDGETEAYTAYVEPASRVYPGRIMLFVGPDAVSAGETFSLMMRGLPQFPSSRRSHPAWCCRRCCPRCLGANVCGRLPKSRRNEVSPGLLTLSARGSCSSRAAPSGVQLRSASTRGPDHGCSMGRTEDRGTLRPRPDDSARLDDAVAAWPPAPARHAKALRRSLTPLDLDEPMRQAGFAN